MGDEPYAFVPVASCAVRRLLRRGLAAAQPYLAVWSGRCGSWFENQPEGPSRRSAKGAGVGRPVPADLRRKSETLDW